MAAEAGLPGEAVLRDALGALRGAPGVSSDWVRFRQALLAAQREALAARAGPGEGDWQASLVARIERAAPGRPGERGGLADARRALEAGALTAAALRAAVAPEAPAQALSTLAEERGITPAALELLGRALAAVDAAASRGEAPQTPRRPGRCPHCGHAAGLALLEAPDGRRTLVCGVCASRYAFDRLRCPACGEAGALSRLRAEREGARFVEACERCRAYLKTVDRRRLDAGVALHPLVEDTATLALDFLAEEQGLVRNPPYVALA